LGFDARCRQLGARFGKASALFALLVSQLPDGRQLHFECACQLFCGLFCRIYGDLDCGQLAAFFDQRIVGAMQRVFHAPIRGDGFLFAIQLLELGLKRAQ